jgi:hypothetical protein
MKAKGIGVKAASGRMVLLHPADAAQVCAPDMIGNRPKMMAGSMVGGRNGRYTRAGLSVPALVGGEFIPDPPTCRGNCSWLYYPNGRGGRALCVARPIGGTTCYEEAEGLCEKWSRQT